MNDDHPHTFSNPDTGVSEFEIGHTPYSKTAYFGTSSNDPSANTTQGSGSISAMLDIANADESSKGDSGSRKRTSKIFKERGYEWITVPRRQGPLMLLDLPVDVLKEIVKEVYTSLPAIFFYLI